MQDQLAQIEKMLEQGMSQDQILKALGVAPAAPATPPGHSMRPVERNSGLLQMVKDFVGIKDGRFSDHEEQQSTIPIPFTQQRLAPADAAMAGMSGFGLGSAVRRIPQAAWKMGLIKRPPLVPHGPQAAPPTFGTSLDDLLGTPAKPSWPGMLTAEEGGAAALQMAPKVGFPRPPAGPRLVPGAPKPRVEDVISNILRELYGK